MSRYALRGALPPPTAGMVAAEFVRTPFAVPVGVLQPVGGRSLVNLPVFFAVSWGDAGFRPGQTRVVTLVGHSVALRIALVGLRYDYGDGASSGLTSSFGGPWPSGDVRHAYGQVGVFSPRVRVELSAEYAVDGGAWQAVPGTATVVGQFPALTVVEARNELVP